MEKLAGAYKTGNISERDSRSFIFLSAAKMTKYSLVMTLTLCGWRHYLYYSYVIRIHAPVHILT